MPREQRLAKLLPRLQAQIRWAWDHSPFYRELWGKAGVHPDAVRSWEDFRTFPFVKKEDLRRDQAEYPPFGRYLCVPLSEVARIHGTSGTTGKPTTFAISQDDWHRIAEAHARIMWGFGVRPSDTVFIASVLSLYMGGWGALVGAERLGCAVFPFGAGQPGQTQRAVQWLQEIRPTVFYGTPSYALHLAEVARKTGVDPSTFGFRILFFSGEPGAGIPATKQAIQDAFGGICVDTGSMAEMTPWMANAECDRRTGMHLWEDIVFTEVVDPETLQPVPPGGQGVPVYTHLERVSQPMIRLWSGDLTTWTDEPCPCGRTYPRLPYGIYGRVDDMVTVRGVNVYPSAVEDVLRGIPGFGGEFRLIVSRAEIMDELVIQVECASGVDRERFKAEVDEKLRSRIGVSLVVEFVDQGTLDRTEFKSRRVIDNRDFYLQARGERRP